MEQVFAIHLWRDDLHEQYCGCWWVECPDDDPAAARLEATGQFGRGLMEDGKVARSFFFADELAEQIDKAERVTECYVESVAMTPRVLGGIA